MNGRNVDEVERIHTIIHALCEVLDKFAKEKDPAGIAADEVEVQYVAVQALSATLQEMLRVRHVPITAIVALTSEGLAVGRMYCDLARQEGAKKIADAAIKKACEGAS